MFPVPALSTGVSLQRKKGVFHNKKSFLYIEYTVNILPAGITQLSQVFYSDVA